MKTITRVLAALIITGWAGSISAVPINGADIVTLALFGLGLAGLVIGRRKRMLYC